MVLDCGVVACARHPNLLAFIVALVLVLTCSPAHAALRYVHGPSTTSVHGTPSSVACGPEEAMLLCATVLFDPLPDVIIFYQSLGSNMSLVENNSTGESVWNCTIWQGNPLYSELNVAAFAVCDDLSRIVALAETPATPVQENVTLSVSCPNDTAVISCNCFSRNNACWTAPWTRGYGGVGLVRDEAARTCSITSVVTNNATWAIQAVCGSLHDYSPSEYDRLGPLSLPQSSALSSTRCPADSILTRCTSVTPYIGLNYTGTYGNVRMGSEQECVAATALNYGVYSSDLHLYHINAARAECTRINASDVEIKEAEVLVVNTSYTYLNCSPGYRVYACTCFNYSNSYCSALSKTELEHGCRFFPYFPNINNNFAVTVQALCAHAVEPVFDEGTLLVDTDMTLNLTLTQPNLTVPGNLFVASNASVFLTNTSHLVVQGNFTLDATAVLVLDASGENGNASAPIQVGGCLELLGPITLHTGYISDTTLYPVAEYSCASTSALVEVPDCSQDPCCSADTQQLASRLHVLVNIDMTCRYPPPPSSPSSASTALLPLSLLLTLLTLSN